MIALITKNVFDFFMSLVKGQLISKCILGVIVLTKKPTKFFKDFCPTYVAGAPVGMWMWGRVHIKFWQPP